jgi:glycosyltransferase involved in cell wall biosynthesis
MMLVGFDATTIRGHMSGVGYYTARLLERLTRVGGEANPIDHLVVFSNVPVPLASLPPRSSIYDQARFGVRAVWMQAVLPSLLRRVRPDVCHFTNFLAPRFADCPYVVTVHDMSLQIMPAYHTLRKRLMTAGLMPEVVRRARLIIAPSESAREDIARLLGPRVAPVEKIRVVPHAAEAEFRPQPEGAFSRLASGYGITRPYLLGVGTLEPRKNIARAVEAFARFVAPRFPEHSFYLVGELGWKYAEVLAAIERHGGGGRIRRLGYVPHADLPALYGHADLLVYPSLYEGFGFPVLEAMACGTPVLTSDCSSLREVAGGAAILVDPLSVEAIAEGMARGLRPGPDRNGLIARGLERAASFCWEKTTEATLAVYAEAAERPAVRAAARPSSEGDDPAARAIARTVAYGALFSFPMKLEEIERSLFGLALGRARIEALLARHPFLRSRLERRGAYYFLRGRGRSVPERWNRERLTRALLHRHQRAVDFVCRTPFVRMVALSGATAHGNAADNDIDLFLVTAPGRAWAVSFLLFVVAKLAGLRRVLCLNYLLSERTLALAERDPFTAHQLVSLRPLAGFETYLRLIEANPWVGEEFPNFARSHRDYTPARGNGLSAGSPWLEAALAWGGGYLLERLGRLLQRNYLRWRARRAGFPRGVKLEDERIKLHFKDHAVPANARLAEILNEVDAEVPKAVERG